MEFGAAVGLIDRLTCPTVWLSTYSEDQAKMDGLVDRQLQCIDDFVTAV